MRSISAALLVATGCASDPTGTEPVTSGAYHHYVTSSLRIPTSAELQREYGLNINARTDPSNKPDNQLGNVFVALTSNSDADLQGVIDAAIGDGSLVLLHSVRADALASDKTVSWDVYVGADRTQPPAFDGTDSFEMGADTSSTEPVLGRTTAGAFAARASGRLTVELKVSAQQPPIALDLIAARVEAQVEAAGCSGKLGGAITQHQVDTVLLPAVVGMMNAAIARDPGCPAACASGTSAALIIEVFDTNEDGMITLAELMGSAIIQTLLAPDLDLLDEAGAAEPDGLTESISLGMGFDCVPASFEVTGELP
jgi:hypothetical protein